MVSLYLPPNFDFYLVFIHAKIRDTAVFEQALVMKPAGKTASSHTKFILNIDFCYVTWPMSFATVWNGLTAQRSLRNALIHCCFSCTRVNSQRQLNEW
jgi:hypothetical protein